MPYKRSYSQAKSKSIWRPYIRATAPAVGYLAKKAAKAAVKKFLNVEYKKASVLQSNASISSATSTPISALVGIGQGDSATLRDGNSIKLTSLSLKYYATIHASATNSIIRVVLVRDHQQVSDSYPSWTEIFEESTVLSHLNTNTVGRFQILYDRFINLNSANIPQSKPKEIYLKQNHHVRYNGVNGTDIQKGGVYLLALSTEPTNTPVLTFATRATYIDN